MQNPFEIIDARLTSIEKLTREAVTFLRISQNLPPEVGGIELAQEVTRLSKARLYALVSARGIPHAKRGNKLYFSRADLMTWVENGRRSEALAPSGYASKLGRSDRNKA